MKKNKRFKRNNMRFGLEIVMLDFGKFLKKLWKATLKSNLYAKDKAEILRLWIFAFTVIVITALFIINRF